MVCRGTACRAPTWDDIFIHGGGTCAMRIYWRNSMPTDFRDAAERHFEDAGYLEAGNRPANADHLFGLSAECALKAVMQGLAQLQRFSP